MRFQIPAVLFAVAVTGCIASGGVGYRAGYVGPPPVTTVSVSASSYNDGPDLVEVHDGVQVIADYDEPVFYSDNFYWRFSGNTWYRSNVHTGGWIVYNDVPHRVRRIDRPTAYVRYRPSGYVPRHQRTNVRDHRQQPTVRDHRTPEPYRQQPTVRDHRTPEPYRQEPTVRDHRDARPQPQPTVRDHRTPQPAPYQPPAPVVRDHRTTTPAPTERDHRDRPAPTERDHRDRDKQKKTERDHR